MVSFVAAEGKLPAFERWQRKSVYELLAATVQRIFVPSDGVGICFVQFFIGLHDRAPIIASQIEVDRDIGWGGVIPTGDVDVTESIVVEI